MLQNQFTTTGSVSSLSSLRVYLKLCKVQWGATAWIKRNQSVLSAFEPLCKSECMSASCTALNQVPLISSADFKRKRGLKVRLIWNRANLIKGSRLVWRVQTFLMWQFSAAVYRWSMKCRKETLFNFRRSLDLVYFCSLVYKLLYVLGVLLSGSKC